MDVFNSIKHSVHRTYTSTVAAVYSPPTQSKYETDGQLTPEEFALAGDLLVHKYPIWTWQACGAGYKPVTYLDAKKQFLVIKGVPCKMRANTFLKQTGAAAAAAAAAASASKTVKAGNNEEWQLLGTTTGGAPATKGGGAPAAVAAAAAADDDDI